ncbi:MAG: hypothetical protein AB8B66_02245 [Rickettsiaceae bacterium]
MIQKLRTYLIRLINWLEDNYELSFIRAVLSSNEDLELQRLYKEINHLKARLITIIDKLSEESQEFEIKVNSAYSHIKRKKKSLKLPKDTFAEPTVNTNADRDLRVSTIQEIIIVTSSLKKLFTKVKKFPAINEAEQMAINIKSELLCDMLLASFKYISTFEGNLMKTKKVS